MDGSNIDISTDVELGDMMLPVRDMSQWVITIPKVAFQMNGSKEVIIEHRACIIVDYEGVREIGVRGRGEGESCLRHSALLFSSLLRSALFSIAFCFIQFYSVCCAVLYHVN